MGKKKKADATEGIEKEGTSLADFVIPQKVAAFINSYDPTDDDRKATDVFDDARLRQFFKAYPCMHGDPLTLYLQMLSDAGFSMRVSISGEPAIFAIAKPSDIFSHI